MSSRLALLEITCDAPPYEIVRACETLGFRSPLDVRWCSMNHVAKERTGWWQRLWDRPWQALLRLGQTSEPRCTCGHELPNLNNVEFTFFCGGKADYLLGQCPRCRTMFWEEA